MFAGSKHCGFLGRIQQKCVQVISVTGERIQPDGNGAAVKAWSIVP